MPFQINRIFADNYKLTLIAWLSGILMGLAYLTLSGYALLIFLVISLLIVTIFKKIEYGFYLIILFIAVERIFLRIHWKDIDYLVLPHIYFVLLTSLAYFLTMPPRDSDKKKELSSISIILILMILYQAISILWTESLSLGIILVLSIITNFFLFNLTSAVITDERSLRITTKVIVAISLIVATGVILSQWLDYEENLRLNKYLIIKLAFGEISDRPAGFGGPAHESGFLILPIFLLAGNVVASKKFSGNIASLLVMTYLIIAVILTASRGALIGMIGGFFILFLIHPSAKSNFIRNSVLFIFLVSLAILIAKPTYIDRILVGFGYAGQLYFSGEGATYTANYDESEHGISGMEQRKYWWKTALYEMADKPFKLILGLGAGGFITTTTAIGTHSVPFSFFFDMGLIGIIIFMFLVIVLYKKCSFYIKNGTRTHCYYVFVVSVIAFVGDVGIHGLVDYDLNYYPSKMLWFPLGYVCALLNIMKSENPQLEG